MLIKSIALFLFLEAIIIQVNAVPLGVRGPGEGSPNAKDRVKKATDNANSLVHRMETVYQSAQNGDVASGRKVKAAFGVTPNMPAIGDSIQKLKVGKFNMVEAQDPTLLGEGAYDRANKLVQLGTGFHVGTTPEQRAGTIIHEASHAILGTSDVFTKDGKPTFQAKPGPTDQIGYRDSNLPSMLRDEKFSKNLHMNADSWRVFGDLCRRELERRALEEPDLMKRDEILESRATACALPSRKPTTPAGGAVKGGKQTATQGGKTPVKGKPNTASPNSRTKSTKPAGGPKKPVRSPAKPPTRGPKKPARSPGKPATGGRPKKPVRSPAKPGTKKPVRSPAKPGTKKPVRSPAKTTTRGPKKPAKPSTRGPKKSGRSPVKPATGGPKKPVRSPTKPGTQGPKKPARSPGKPGTQGPKKPARSPGKPGNQGPRKPARSPVKPATGGPKKPVRGPPKPATQGPKKPSGPATRVSKPGPARPNPAAKPATGKAGPVRGANPVNKSANKPVNKTPVRAANPVKPAVKPAVVSKVAPVLKVAVKAAKK